MKRISSKMTYFHKKIFPIIWFGFILFFICLSLFAKFFLNQAIPFQIFVFPTLMFLFGFFILKKIVFDLLDEVYDCGDYLLVKNGEFEDKIFLKDIRNVSYSVMVNPKRVTLDLRVGCRFGKEISFSPLVEFSFNPFYKSPVIDDLINRIDQA